MELADTKKIAIELWTWLAETGNRNKSYWPRWEKYGVMTNDCPLCEFAYMRGEDDYKTMCNACPLQGKWGRGSSKYYECEYAEGSPFAVWRKANDVTIRKEAAWSMVSLLRTIKVPEENISSPQKFKIGAAVKITGGVYKNERGYVQYINRNAYYIETSVRGSLWVGQDYLELEK